MVSQQHSGVVVTGSGVGTRATTTGTQAQTGLDSQQQTLQPQIGFVLQQTAISVLHRVAQHAASDAFSRLNRQATVMIANTQNIFI